MIRFCSKKKKKICHNYKKKSVIENIVMNISQLVGTSYIICGFGFEHRIHLNISIEEKKKLTREKIL